MFVKKLYRSVRAEDAALFTLSFLWICVIIQCVFLSGTDTRSVSAQAAGSPPVLILDPGHGGADGGASANGLTEKDINLSVALKLKDKIEQNGGSVTMTRDGDYSTADENRTDGTSAKKSDLKRRREMVSESGANMFVSIHMNKFPQEKYWGAQVFYADTPDSSQKLGEAIQSALPRILNDGNERTAKKTNGSIYILKNASVPSVIVECGFLSNPNEAERLKSDDYQTQLADAIFEGICDYLKTADVTQDA